MVPEQIVFTVDFFDALYLATCMPSVSTTSLALVFARLVISVEIAAAFRCSIAVLQPGNPAKPGNRRAFMYSPSTFTRR
ncbi:hypothetical protein GQ600_10719 [Phytophthora cactorum]|nr:hypothetical protein GQ600_10719 [Phytophthora cactorum]